jgi:glycosyltransferase involved in cell wall biosynthesis
LLRCCKLGLREPVLNGIATMSELPLVSVIIPCYKQAHYLREAVDSVLAQTYPRVEAVVVNDGSPDDTETVAKGYGERIRYVWRPNGGISAARNSGFAESRGAFVKFLDSDDLLHKEQIAWQMEMLAGREDAVSFGACRLFRDGHPEEYLDHIPRAKAMIPDLLRGEVDWGSILCWLFPRRLVAAVGGFVEGVHYAEDWYFLCRVGLLDPQLFIDSRIGCYYRQRAGSASANRTGWVQSQARLLLELHDSLRASGRADWFGRELLRFEQGAYQGLVNYQVTDRGLGDNLLIRIKDLQRTLGIFGTFGWRFQLMARVLGYARAERLRSFIVRKLKIRAPETLDTAAWRHA